MLARISHVNGVEPIVVGLERDRHARARGAMLDVHADSG